MSNGAYMCICACARLLRSRDLSWMVRHARVNGRVGGGENVPRPVLRAMREPTTFTTEMHGTPCACYSQRRARGE